MSRVSRHSLAITAALICSLVWFTNAAVALEKSEVLHQARSKYYSLSAHGFAGMQCTVTPNWEGLLQGAVRTDPAAVDRALSLLRQLQFQAVVAGTGSAKVTHNSISAPDPDRAKALELIYGGMAQMTAGFFDTWSLFMIKPPFPLPTGDYQLADQGSLWNLSYKDGTADVITIMSKDLVIQEIRVDGPAFRTTMRPQFLTSSEGFLLAGYYAEYFGTSPDSNVVLNTSISYQPVTGLQFPQHVSLSGTYGGSPFQVELNFADCQAGTR